MRKVIATLAWAAGICLAGSEGPFWINASGVVIFSLATTYFVSKGALNG